jgi:uncharacterized protein
MENIILIYLTIGVVAGFLSGLLGVGGGVLIVPALVWAYEHQGMPPEIIMHMAAGTSLASMIISAASSLRHHLHHQIQVWFTYRQLALGVAVGTFLGTLLAKILHSHLLIILFGIFLLIIALIMLFGGHPKPSRQLPGKLGMTGMGLLIGAKSGLFGLGGGVITIPFLTYCNVPMRNTVGVSIACSLTVAIIGTLGFILTGYHVPNLPAWSTGYVYWPGILGITLTSPVFALFGTRVSHALPVAILKKLFALFLILIALHLFIH